MLLTQLTVTEMRSLDFLSQETGSSLTAASPSNTMCISTPLAMFQNPVVGSWFRTTHGCRGYDALPEGRLGADRRLIASEWWIPTDTYIGPVTEVKETEKYVSVFVKGWWIDVWIRTHGKKD